MLVPGSLMTSQSHGASPGLCTARTVSLSEKEISNMFKLLRFPYPRQPDLILSHTVGKSNHLQRYTWN